MLAGALYFGEIFAPTTEAEDIPAPLSETATLLVVETESCGWCKRFRRDVAPTYPQSRNGSLAPLRYVHVRDVKSSGYRLSSSVRSVPTFIVVDQRGHEVDRISGYPGGGQAFYQPLDRILARVPAESREAVR